MTDLLTEVEAAEKLRLPARTLRYWRSTNTGPAYLKLGRAVRYSPTDLERWVNAHRETPRRPR